MQDNPGLPAQQKAVLLLDCYPVHTSAEFLDYLRNQHPYVQPMFVPANCTGVFQPADVGLQRVIKHHLKQFTLAELVCIHSAEIAKGTKLEDIQFSNSITILCNSSVEAMLDVWRFMKTLKGRELIEKAWRKCSAKGWNLSHSSLTSSKARVALREYLKVDETLREEIFDNRGNNFEFPVIFDQDTQDCTECIIDDYCDDDSAVPLSSVVRDALGVDMSPSDNPLDSYCADTEFIAASREPDSAGLISNAEEENVWNFSDNGTLWSYVLQGYTNNI